MHFSLALHTERRLARWVAWNIDGTTRWDGDDIPRQGLRFLPDPRIPVDAQITDPVYDHNRLDRGHLARRADLLWGSRAEAEVANRHSFFFTNITPQMDNFNQSGQNGIWGRLENAVLATTGTQKVSLLGGPVLAADDPAYRGVLVPLMFWKVLVYRPDGQELRARAFLVTQSLKGLRVASPLDEFATYEVTTGRRRPNARSNMTQERLNLMGRLNGKVAYITGGARGMGAAFARTFAREGANIILSDICSQIDTVRYPLGSKDELEAVAQDIRDMGQECVAEVADVRDQDQLDAVTTKGLEEFGQIDIVCANAGIHSVGKFWTMSEQQWDDMIGVNLTGIWKTAKSTAPSMIDRQSGSVIVTASVSGREPLPEYCHYTAAKHGVIGLARAIGVELGPNNIRVNTILPGPTDTPLNDNPINRDWAAGFPGATTNDMHAAIRHWHNLRGRGALPVQAIANAALWLASDDAEHVHGSELVVDAGHLLLAGFNHAPVQPEGYPRRGNEGYNPYAE